MIIKITWRSILVCTDVEMYGVLLWMAKGCWDGVTWMTTTWSWYGWNEYNLDWLSVIFAVFWLNDGERNVRDGVSAAGVSEYNVVVGSTLFPPLLWLFTVLCCIANITEL